MSGIVRFSPGVGRNMFRTYVFRGMDGTPRVFRGSPERERRAFSVHHATGRAVQEDEHLLPLVLVLHEPHGGVEELAVVRRRVDLDRLQVVDALLRLLLRARVAVGHHAHAGARADVLRPLEVRDDGGRDDPVRDVPQRHLTEVRSLRDFPAEDPLVEPLPARIEGRLVRELVVEHEVLLEHLGRAAGAHRGHGAAILAHDQGEARAGLQGPATRIAFHALWHGRRSHLLDRGVRVVGLARGGCPRHPGSLPRISGGRGHAGLAALGRSDDAQSGATEVTEDRAVRDSSTALVTEQGETSCSPAMASPTYLRIPRPVSWLRPSLPEGALKYRESNPLRPAWRRAGGG